MISSSSGTYGSIEPFESLFNIGTVDLLNAFYQRNRGRARTLTTNTIVLWHRAVTHAPITNAHEY
jgi:hypothetical protein